MENSVVAAVVLGGALLLLLSWAALNRVRQQQTARNAKIPRGSNGWPLIGETLDFANADPLAFVGPRVKK